MVWNPIRKMLGGHWKWLWPSVSFYGVFKSCKRSRWVFWKLTRCSGSMKMVHWPWLLLCQSLSCWGCTQHSLPYLPHSGVAAVEPVPVFWRISLCHQSSRKCFRKEMFEKLQWPIRCEYGTPVSMKPWLTTNPICIFTGSRPFHTVLTSGCQYCWAGIYNMT